MITRTSTRMSTESLTFFALKRGSQSCDSLTLWVVSMINISEPLPIFNISNYLTLYSIYYIYLFTFLKRGCLKQTQFPRCKHKDGKLHAYQQNHENFTRTNKIMEIMWLVDCLWNFLFCYVLVFFVCYKNVSFSKWTSEQRSGKQEPLNYPCEGLIVCLCFSPTVHSNMFYFE